MQGEKEKSVFEAGTEYNASKEPVIQPPATVLQRNRSRLNVALETPAVTKGSFFLGLRDPPTSAGVRGWSSALETPLSTTTSLKTPGAIMRDLRKQQESAATFQTHSEMDQEDVEANDSWLFQDAPFQNCNLEMSPKGRDARLPSISIVNTPVALSHRRKNKKRKKNRRSSRLVEAHEMAMILDDQLTSDAIGEEFPNDILDPVTFALQTPFVSKPINRTPSTSKSVAVLPKTPRLNGSGQRLSIGSHCDAQESVDMFCSTPVTEPGTQIPLENTPKLDMKSFLKKFKRTYSMDLKRETVGPVVEEPQSLQIKNYGDTLGDSQNSIFNIEKSDTVPGMDGYVLETAKPASVLMDDIEEVQSLYEHEHLKTDIEDSQDSPIFREEQDDFAVDANEVTFGQMLSSPDFKKPQSLVQETTASAKEFDDSEEFMMGDFSQSILCQVDQMSQSLKPSSSVHQKPISRNVPCLPQESPLKRKNSGISDQAFKTPLAPQSRPIMSGFSSARGSSLPSISKEARDKAASLLGDVLSSHDPALKNSTDSQIRNVPAIASKGGFSSARGTPLPVISEAARAKVASLVGDAFGFNTAPTSPTTAASTPVPGNFKSSTGGFASASGKALAKLSEAALKKAANLFANDLSTANPLESTASTPFKTPYKNGPVSTSSGFSTARGSNLPPVSDASLRKAALIWNDATPNSTATSLSRTQINSALISEPPPPLRTPPASKAVVGNDFKTPSHPFRGPKFTRGSASTINRKKVLHPGARMTPVAKQVHAKETELTRLFDLTPCPTRISLARKGPLQKFPDGISCLPNDILSVTWESASSVLFDRGANKVGWPELRHLLIKAGALGQLATEAWSQNHYQFIVLKVACIVRQFPILRSSYWSSDKVLSDLSYRYETEFNIPKSSAIKAILERDNFPNKHMVLYVSKVKLDSYEIWLSDGWYQIQALLDPPLKEYLKCRRIFQGQKLHIWDAKISGSRDACTPLEMPAEVRLQIHANGTRRARWHTRLGFHPSPYQTIGVNRAIRGGGPVPCLDLVLCRVYNVRYLESLPDGKRRILSEEEEQFARKQRLASFESKVQELHQIKEKERMNSKEDTPDSVPMEEKFRKCHEEIMDEALDFIPERKVTQFLPLKVTDYLPVGLSQDKAGMAGLTIWNVGDDLLSQLKEGKRYRVFKADVDAPRGGLSSFSCNKTGIIEAPVDPERLDSTLYTRRNIRYAKDLRANNSMDMVLVVLRLVCGNDGATNRVLAPNKMHKQFVICCDSQAEIVILKRESPYPLRTIQIGTRIGVMNVDVFTLGAGYPVIQIFNNTSLVMNPSRISYMDKALQELNEWIEDHPSHFLDLQCSAKDIQMFLAEK